MSEEVQLIGLDRSHRERISPRFEAELMKYGITPRIRKLGDSMSVFDKVPLIVYPSPITGGSAKEVLYLVDFVKDGGHILLNAGYRNKQELNTFQNSEFGKEFLTAFEIGPIFGNESGEGIRFYPPEEKFKHFRCIHTSKKKSPLDLYITEFIVRKGEFEQKLVNTKRLTFMEDYIPVETAEPPMFLHFDSIPEENVSIERKVSTPNIKKLLRIGTDGKDEFFGGYTDVHFAIQYGTPHFDPESDIKIYELVEVSLKTGVFRRFGDYGALVHAIAYDMLNSDNMPILLKMYSESMQSRSHILADYERPKPITSDVSLEI